MAKQKPRGAAAGGDMRYRYRYELPDVSREDAIRLRAEAGFKGSVVVEDRATGGVVVECELQEDLGSIKVLAYLGLINAK